MNQQLIFNHDFSFDENTDIIEESYQLIFESSYATLADFGL